MKKILHKKYLTPVLALGMLLALIAPGIHPAFAQTTPQTPSFLDCVTSPATCGVFYAALSLNNIIALFVSLGAFLIRVTLQFNQHLFDSPMIQTGFSVSLAIANLGFVLGIIVIALATIIRNSTYGIKQLLWKLVAMAILVNFGLVIASPIVNLSDSLTNYFVTATAGSGIGADGGEGFALKMMTAFAPQSFTAPPTAGSTAGTACSAALFLVPVPGTTALCNMLSQSFGKQTPADTFTQTLLAVVFGIIFTSLTAYTFLGLAALLLVRYVALAILLVLLPLAWLTWIFPAFSSNFSKWWHEFIRWTFFPPLALFFIYLAFQTATQTATGQAYLQKATRLPSGTASGVEAAVATQTGLVDPIQQAANEILLLGITVGGILAAASLSGKAGGMVVDTAKSAGKRIGKYTAKKGKQAASYPLRTRTGRRFTEKLQTAGVGRGILGRTLLRPVRETGNILSNAKGSTEKLVSDKQKELGKTPLAEQARRLYTQDNAGKLAILTNFDKALKDKDKGTRDGAKKAFDELPKNLRKEMDRLMKDQRQGGSGRMDRLKTLYGKDEYVAKPSEFAKQKSFYEAEIKKKSEAGESTADLEELLAGLEEAEKKQTNAITDEASKTRKAIRDTDDTRPTMLVTDDTTYVPPPPKPPTT